MARRLLAVFLQILIVLVPTMVLGLLLASRWWPPATAVSLVLKGQSGGCTISQSLNGIQAFNNLVAADAEAKRTSQRLAVEGPLELWQTGMGRFWIETGQADNFAYNISEEKIDLYGAGDVGVRNGDIVLDCGANYGVFTRKALEQGARIVVAIDLAPGAVACLRKTFTEEIQAGRVIVYPKGVWDREDSLPLYTNPNNMGANSVVRGSSQSKKSLEVPLTTIDRIVAELNLPKVDFIKMDIEGAEIKALKGAIATLKRNKPRLAIALYHNENDREDVPRAVAALEPAYRFQKLCLTTPAFIRPEAGHFSADY